MKQHKAVRPESVEDYSGFKEIDGTHPWMEQVPEGAILYPVRKLTGGRISYFNFDLAKEMGLIHDQHPHHISKKLEQILLDTFCIRIINEYDQTHDAKFAPHSIKPNMYMATRYLQLQHPDKAGRTSGDGRGIWNGTWFDGERTWDISSRGTGVTILAPGAVEAGRPLQSGSHEFGYGCGLADIDELFGAALMAEIFHRNGHPTERVLAIIDLGKGVGIGVRSAPNLFRPAHFFPYLKQSRLPVLKRAVDFFVQRQLRNGEWKKPTRAESYQWVQEEICENFAKFTAYLERDYIFAWLDWDGDNVLANAGIIDYGSVRQFGLRHDQYRYDDVDRFSTTLGEQRQKARQIVQVYAQLFDYLDTEKRKSVSYFKNHPLLKTFDERFDHHLLDRFLYQVGFEASIRRLLLNRHRNLAEEFFKVHSQLEKVKTRRKQRKVADGVHRPAILNMRSILATYPSRLKNTAMESLTEKEFFETILSSQASRKDRRLSPNLKNKIRQWQMLYREIIEAVSTKENRKKLLDSVDDRAQRINREDRITGNALINIVEEILKYRRRGCTRDHIQMVLEEYIEYQTLCPDHKVRRPSQKNSDPVPLLQTLLTVTYGFREDI